MGGWKEPSSPARARAPRETATGRSDVKLAPSSARLTSTALATAGCGAWGSLRLGVLAPTAGGSKERCPCWSSSWARGTSPATPFSRSAVKAVASHGGCDGMVTRDMSKSLAGRRDECCTSTGTARAANLWMTACDNRPLMMRWRSSAKSARTGCGAFAAVMDAGAAPMAASPPPLASSAAAVAGI